MSKSINIFLHAESPFKKALYIFRNIKQDNNNNIKKYRITGLYMALGPQEVKPSRISKQWACKGGNFVIHMHGPPSTPPNPTPPPPPGKILDILTYSMEQSSS
jgi:hypothetical protein